jgi:hypothetical protein
VIPVTENSNKFQKNQVLEGRKEKSVENVVTLEGFLPFNSSMIFLSYLAV